MSVTMEEVGLNASSPEKDKEEDRLDTDPTPEDPEGGPDGTAEEGDGTGTAKKSKGRSLRDLNSTQRYLLLALCILYFALYVLLSLMGPFFPIQVRVP